MTDALRFSVQRRSYAGAIGALDTLPLAALMNRQERLTDVPLYGVLAKIRDRSLRALWTRSGAEPISAAISLRVQKLQTMEWTLEGPKRVARQVHSMLHNANFGMGWEDFVAKFVIDWDTQDNGAFVELIGQGDPDGVLSGPVLGIANLDSQRCQRTGDPEYPVIYFDLNGGLHRLHRTRVWFQADMPSPDERRFGVGFSALSRAVSVAQRTILWSEMSNELMDDFPSAGALVVRGMNKDKFDFYMKQYEAERRSKAQEVYHGLITLFYPNAKPTDGVELVPFRQVWQGFNQKEHYDILIDLVAMCFNMDRQELAPMSGGSLGSGNQSKTLSRKGRDKGITNTAAQIERLINKCTPQSVTYRHDYEDLDEEMERWQVNNLKVNTFMTIYTAKQPDSNVSINSVSVNTPSVQPTDVEPVISREELRYLFGKHGILPRELLQPADNLAPDFQRFDEITVKALKRFGPSVVIEKGGKERLPLPAWQAPLALPLPALEHLLLPERALANG